ncbi:unnamed protein product [Boreogadus saida]
MPVIFNSILVHTYEWQDWIGVLPCVITNENYSYSPELGAGSGTPFVTSGEGSITGVAIWEHPGNNITGIQLQHGTIGGPMFSVAAAPKSFNFYPKHAEAELLMLSGRSF